MTKRFDLNTIIGQNEIHSSLETKKAEIAKHQRELAMAQKVYNVMNSVQQYKEGMVTNDEMLRYIVSLELHELWSKGPAVHDGDKDLITGHVAPTLKQFDDELQKSWDHPLNSPV